MAINTCSHCSQPLPDIAAYCSKCGLRHVRTPEPRSRKGTYLLLSGLSLVVAVAVSIPARTSVRVDHQGGDVDVRVESVGGFSAVNHVHINEVPAK